MYRNLYLSTSLSITYLSISIYLYLPISLSPSHDVNVCQYLRVWLPLSVCLPRSPCLYHFIAHDRRMAAAAAAAAGAGRRGRRPRRRGPRRSSATRRGRGRAGRGAAPRTETGPAGTSAPPPMASRTLPSRACERASVSGHIRVCTREGTGARVCPQVANDEPAL